MSRNRFYLRWSIGGYLLTSLILGIFIIPIGFSFPLSVILWAFVLLIPFAVAYYLVLKLIGPMIAGAVNQNSATCRGIAAALAVAILVSAFFALATGVQELMSSRPNSGFTDKLHAFTAHVLIAFSVGVAWSAIPATLIGGTMGFCAFKKYQTGQARSHEASRRKA